MRNLGVTLTEIAELEDLAATAPTTGSTPSSMPPPPKVVKRSGHAGQSHRHQVSGPEERLRDRPWLAPTTRACRGNEGQFNTGLDMFRAAEARQPDTRSAAVLRPRPHPQEVDRAHPRPRRRARGQRLRAGDRPPCTSRTCPQFVVAMLATWKAGGIMVSINPMNKARELEFLLVGLRRQRARVASNRCTRRRRRDVVTGGTRAAVVTTSELDFSLAAPRPLVTQDDPARPADTDDLVELIAATTARRPPPDTHRRRRRLPRVHVGHGPAHRRARRQPSQRGIHLEAHRNWMFVDPGRRRPSASPRCSTYRPRSG